ncbi:MAG TPA: hypothetical protein VE981_03835 [Planctomycetota bacterium]|nr:hypothetical protein [Planctomycetota bacterium]
MKNPPSPWAEVLTVLAIALIAMGLPTRSAEAAPVPLAPTTLKHTIDERVRVELAVRDRVGR